jgi:hypothetical protein
VISCQALRISGRVVSIKLLAHDATQSEEIGVGASPVPRECGRETRAVSLIGVLRIKVLRKG